MTLEAAIAERAREIKTDGYSMSIGEVLSMYRDGDLEVHPEFQRIFRWDSAQKSRLIESILLGIPIPTIFVAQRDDGVWDVIDGVQRLSTILEFVGEYRDEEGRRVNASTLEPTEYLPQLVGRSWEGQGELGLSDSLRRDFKRAKLEFRIIKKESDPNSKYDLFQRLNSGTQLSPQESRNCLMVMLDVSLFEWMNTLAAEPAFVESVQLSAQKEDEGFRQELVLRFLLQLQMVDPGTELPEELGEYITHWVRFAGVKASPDKRIEWERAFRTTFRVLIDAVGEDVFRRYDSAKHRFLGGFSISSFEAITSGVGANADAWQSASDAQRLGDLVRELWSTEDFRQNSGSGISPRRRTPRMVRFGRTFFAP